MMPTQDVREFVVSSRNVWTDTEALGKRNMKLASEVQKKKRALATKKPAQLKSWTEELISVSSKLVTSCVESANSRWSAHSVAKGVSKVEEDVSNALKAMSSVVTDATRWVESITGSELKNALKQVSTQIETELPAAILRIRTEHESDDRETFLNVVTCRAVLFNHLAELCRSLPDTINLVASFDAKIAVVDPKQTGNAILDQVPKDGTETGCTEDR